MSGRSGRGRSAQAGGLAAENLACAALEAEGWTVLGRRLRNAGGEIDIAAERDGLLALVEVKARRSLADAALAILPRQQSRLIAAAAILLGEHPDWGINGVRFDAMLVAPGGQVRRIRDAFRVES